MTEEDKCHINASFRSMDLSLNAEMSQHSFELIIYF